MKAEFNIVGLTQIFFFLFHIWFRELSYLQFIVLYFFFLFYTYFSQLCVYYYFFLVELKWLEYSTTLTVMNWTPPHLAFIPIPKSQHQ